jgi:hypothetical protein
MGSIPILATMSGATNNWYRIIAGKTATGAVGKRIISQLASWMQFPIAKSFAVIATTEPVNTEDHKEE